MTEATHVRELLEITKQLSAVLEREVEIVRAKDSSELPALHEDKRALCAAFEAQLKALGQPADARGEAPGARGQDLLVAIARFKKVLRRNEQTLRAARDTSERVLRAITEAVENKRGEAAGYGASGARVERSQRTGTQPLPLAIDQRL